MSIEFNMIVDELMSDIDTVEKANFHYNLFREYKEQVIFYEDDYKDIKKQKLLIQMCNDLHVPYYQSSYLRKLICVSKPRFMDEPNPIIFMFYKNVMYKYLEYIDGKLKNRKYWYSIE